jgi:spermidine synthase
MSAAALQAPAVPLPRNRLLAQGVMLASGFAGLGYQLVWTQQGAVWLGHEAASLLAVLSAFFGGVACGAWALARRVQAARRPALWYAGCEVLIGAWSLVLAWAMPAAGALLLSMAGAQPSPAWQAALSFGGMFVLLLPATAAMGATLPAMARIVDRRADGPDNSAGHGAVAWLYACNTAGAVLGVLATAFWLLPAIGLQRTAWCCAAVNLLCAVCAWRMGAGRPLEPASQTTAAPATAPPAAVPALAWLAATGFLGIALEVLVVRVLSQVNENTVYTYAILLAVYLVGTAAGAAWHRRLGSVHALALRLAAACMVSMLVLWQAETLRRWGVDTFGPGMARALATEALVALAAFAMPTLLMGALFSRLALQAQQQGVCLGRALGVNTLGAALAPPVVGAVLAPAWGAKAALLLVVAGYALLAGPRQMRRPLGLAVAGCVLAAAVAGPSLVFVDVPEGGRIVSLEDGALAAVSVVEDAEGVLRLRINNRQQEGSSSSLAADARQAWLPLLLHPAPRTVLFLGLGTGMTARSAAVDPTLRVQAVELLPEVVRASELFVAAGGGQGAALEVLRADARRHVRSTSATYDVVIADNVHPARSGTGALYTVEHFAAVRARLASGGVFCQWLPLHQLDLDTLRSIVRSYQAVFPQASAVLATNSLATPVLGLLGWRDGSGVDLPAVLQRVQATVPRMALQRYDIHDAFDVLGSRVAGPAELAAFAGAAPLNTDDHPVVAYSAPALTYAPDSTPQDRLLALLAPWRPDPRSWLLQPDAAQATGWPQRMAAYGDARKRYLDMGRQVRPTPDPQAMLARVEAPLLEVLRGSADFRPAREPLRRLADAVQAADPEAARRVRQALGER